MKMIVVTIPGTNLSQPPAISVRRGTEFPLDDRVHKDSVHVGRTSSHLQYLLMVLVPNPMIQARSRIIQQGGRFDCVTKWIRCQFEQVPLQQLEPDVYIQPGLMALMAVGHRSASRLRQIANLQNPQASPFDRPAEALHETDQGWMPVITAAGEVHRAIACAIPRKGLRAGNAPAGWLPDDTGRAAGRPVDRRPILAGDRLHEDQC